MLCAVAVAFVLRALSFSQLASMHIAVELVWIPSHGKTVPHDWEPPGGCDLGTLGELNHVLKDLR